MARELSTRSLNNLEGVHKSLRKAASSAIRFFHFEVIEGVRSKERQNELVNKGYSQVSWPNSKHNIGEKAGRQDAHAFDFVPKPVDWQDERRFSVCYGVIRACFLRLQLSGDIDPHWKLRWGGNWDMDEHMDDNKFDDLGHIEIVSS